MSRPAASDPSRANLTAMLLGRAVEQALQSAEAPMLKADVANKCRDVTRNSECIFETLELLVDQGRVLRLGTGDSATFWLRRRELHVSQLRFKTSVQA